MVSKLDEDSGSRRSMLIVRQLSLSEAVVTCWMMDILCVMVFCLFGLLGLLGRSDKRAECWWREGKVKLLLLLDVIDGGVGLRLALTGGRLVLRLWYLPRTGVEMDSRGQRS